jgi:aspartate ammonia-lyase
LQDYPLFIHGLAYTKLAAAKANNALGLVSDEQLKSIEAACKDILDGKYHDQFQVDMIQGGAGTSTNMNANEVIAKVWKWKCGNDKCTESSWKESWRI